MLIDLLKRFVQYASSKYLDQLQAGQVDLQLTCVIFLICLLETSRFLDTDRPHHRFQVVDLTRLGRVSYWMTTTATCS